MAAGTQQLFLMEFLVDRVNIPNVRAIGEQTLPATTCVSFQVSNPRCSCRNINEYRNVHIYKTKNPN